MQCRMVQLWEGAGQESVWGGAELQRPRAGPLAACSSGHPGAVCRESLKGQLLPPSPFWARMKNEIWCHSCAWAWTDTATLSLTQVLQEAKSKQGDTGLGGKVLLWIESRLKDWKQRIKLGRKELSSRVYQGPIFIHHHYWLKEEDE